MGAFVKSKEEAMISESRIKVRYAETDRMGIVYHANYLVWFEIARAEFLEKLGFPYTEVEKAGYMSPVVDVQLSYGSPLTYGDTAVVRTRVVGVSPAKTEYAYEVYKEGQVVGADKPCCMGRTSHCLVSAQTFRPQSQKRVMPALYAAYQEALEEE